MVGDFGPDDFKLEDVDYAIFVGRKIGVVGRRSFVETTRICLKAMIRELRMEGGGTFVEYNGIENCLKEVPIPAELMGLFEEYFDVFQPLTTLPPTRQQDHAMNLKEGTIRLMYALIDIPTVKRMRLNV